MSRLQTKGGDNTETPIDLEVPVLPMEDDFEPPKLDEHEVAIHEKGKDDHLKTVKHIPMYETLASKSDDL